MKGGLRPSENQENQENPSQIKKKLPLDQEINVEIKKCTPASG